MVVLCGAAYYDANYYEGAQTTSIKRKTPYNCAQWEKVKYCRVVDVLGKSRDTFIGYVGSAG